MDKDFIDELRCPACAGQGKGILELKDAMLGCTDCGNTCRIEDGIPVMLIEDYVPLKAQ